MWWNWKKKHNTIKLSLNKKCVTHLHEKARTDIQSRKVPGTVNWYTRFHDVSETLNLTIGEHLISIEVIRSHWRHRATSNRRGVTSRFVLDATTDDNAAGFLVIGGSFLGLLGLQRRLLLLSSGRHSIHVASVGDGQLDGRVIGRDRRAGIGRAGKGWWDTAQVYIGL